MVRKDPRRFQAGVGQRGLKSRPAGNRMRQRAQSSHFRAPAELFAAGALAHVLGLQDGGWGPCAPRSAGRLGERLTSGALEGRLFGDLGMGREPATSGGEGGWPQRFSWPRTASAWGLQHRGSDLTRAVERPRGPCVSTERGLAGGWGWGAGVPCSLARSSQVRTHRSSSHSRTSAVSLGW